MWSTVSVTRSWRAPTWGNRAASTTAGRGASSVGHPVHDVPTEVRREDRDMSVDRIAKLLQMAERAKTPEESAAFFAKAQALATVHQITLAQARQRLPSGAREQPVQKLLTVGRPRQQANRHYLRLLVALART